MTGLRQKHSLSSFARHFSLLVLTLTLLLLPCQVFADSFLFVRLVDGLDLNKMSAFKDIKLSAEVKMDGNGDIMLDCLNLSIPVAHHPLSDNPVMQKLMQRTRLKVDPRGKGVVVKLAFAF